MTVSTILRPGCCILRTDFFLRGHGRIEPHKSYDARSSAPVANGGANKDYYMENGDPGKQLHILSICKHCNKS